MLSSLTIPAAGNYGCAQWCCTRPVVTQPSVGALPVAILTWATAWLSDYEDCAALLLLASGAML